MPTEYIISGNVQGVGFRFRTTSIAQRHAVTGFVRNLANGDVQIVVDGAADDIRQFVEDVTRAMRDYIRQVDRRDYVTDEQFSSFEIRR